MKNNLSKYKYNNFLKIYKIKNELYLSYDNKYQQKCVGLDGKLYTQFEKIKISIINIKGKQSFNLQKPLEKQLAKIYSFYQILNGVEESLFGYLYYTVVGSKRQEFEIYGCEECGEYWIGRNDYNDMNEVEFKCNTYQLSEGNIPPIPEGKLNIKEFYLLMQIYLGLYNENKLKEKLEKNEIKGKYDEVKEKGFYADTGIDVEIMIEYLKLELMRKDISGAFDGLEIEKIYDKDWSEEKQKKHIDEINKEFGEEVIVEE